MKASAQINVYHTLITDDNTSKHEKKPSMNMYAHKLNLMNGT